MAEDREANVREMLSPDRLVYTVEEAGVLLGLSRWAAYAAAKRGDIPTIRIGRRLIVPRVQLERMLAGEETV